VVNENPAGGTAGSRQISRRWRRALPVVLVAPLVLLAACSGGGHGNNKSDALAPVAGSGGKPGQGSPTQPAAPPVTLVLSPSAGASNVDPAQPVKVSAAGGRIDSVSLTASNGAGVPGSFSLHNALWEASTHLATNTSYTLKVTGANAAGQTTTKTSTFSTLTPSSKLTITQYEPDNGTTMGVGEPIMVNFNADVPQAQRAAIEKSMTVTTTPAVKGAWSWMQSWTSSGSRVDWRPESYWPAGTHVHVHLGLDGVSAGNGRYGWETRDFSFTIGADQRVIINTAAHNLTVYHGNTAFQSFPVDTGKAGFQTWGGTMVILDKAQTVEMKSCSVGLGCDPSSPTYYDLMVHWNLQLTNSGTYIHAAPWDSSIGVDNTSHGCVHMTDANATWMFDHMNVGDPVTITGEPDTVAENNGYGDWSLSWSQWLANSAAGVS
jgi:lipoprotein-anchoring transpeptidase ErfK/SrfK